MQEYWSGLTFPPLGDLPDPGTEPASPALQADFLTTEPPRKPSNCILHGSSLGFINIIFIPTLISGTFGHLSGADYP